MSPSAQAIQKRVTQWLEKEDAEIASQEARLPRKKRPSTEVAGSLA